MIVCASCFVLLECTMGVSIHNEQTLRFMLVGMIGLRSLRPQKQVDQSRAYIRQCLQPHRKWSYWTCHIGNTKTCSRTFKKRCGSLQAQAHLATVLFPRYICCTCVFEAESTSKMIASQKHAYTNAPIFAASQAKRKDISIVFLVPQAKFFEMRKILPSPYTPS